MRSTFFQFDYTCVHRSSRQAYCPKAGMSFIAGLVLGIVMRSVLHSSKRGEVRRRCAFQLTIHCLSRQRKRRHIPIKRLSKRHISDLLVYYVSADDGLASRPDVAECCKQNRQSKVNYIPPTPGSQPPRRQKPDCSIVTPPMLRPILRHPIRQANAQRWTHRLRIAAHLTAKHSSRSSYWFWHPEHQSQQATPCHLHHSAGQQETTHSSASPSPDQD